MAKVTSKQVLDVARDEIGYCEKETNSQLNDKTANAGDGNYTKYWVDLRNAGYYQASKQGFAWCDGWVDWCFWKACGENKTDGEWTECQTGLYGAGCEWSSDCYRRAGRFGTEPKVGAQIFFGKENSEEHTGLVEKFDDNYVYTIEGNTSNKVARRTYKRTSDYIVGYGYPRYLEEEVKEPVTGTASTGSASDEKTIWDFLKAKGLNDYAIAGVMGNLYAESALRSNNLQQTYERSLGYTDDTYTTAVDNGSYTNFVKDSAGYGLAQWTYWSRKENLLKYAQAANKSIGDFNTQLDFLWKELQGYTSVMNVIKAAKSVKEVSDAFMCKFENPADQSDTAKNKRASYGQKYYDKYAVKPAEPQKPVEPAKKSNEEIAQEVLNGKWGNGEERKQKLAAAGYDYSAVQKIVNELCKKPAQPAKKSNEEIAKEVLAGKWGNGAERKQKLEAAGYNYREVQNIVNKLCAKPAKKSVDEIAREVINGKWGNGAERKKKLTEAGYNYSEVQARVNKLLQ